MSLPPTPHGELQVGRLLTYTRRYSPAEIASYDSLSGRVRAPRGSAGELPDLLVVAPLTKLGGDLNYLARKMTWRRTRPVLADEELTAELEVLKLEEDAGFHRIAFDARVRAGDGEVVLDGHSKGLVLHVADAPTSPGEQGGDAAPHPGRPEADAALLDGIAPRAVLRGSATVTAEDIALCAEITGDYGAHHLGHSGERQMAQGLLTSTSVPLIRGDRGFRHHTVSMVFLQPVHVGDTVDSEVLVEEVAAPAGEGAETAGEGANSPEPVLTLSTTVRNQNGTEVLVSQCTGAFADAAG
ncbi:hypothetical protein E0L36_18050 [Streptomyces sp. AJS327]|uniref:hypothetical protein n=1 Tax=Streptomyces sp. AJS327 TaxID=2545265 RepID=UPI0015E04BB3|nr:hypothetical protein [Streptomyces sp. AJS327]MBA0052709.1 hypothetical protein [Streptomyces sp. AJS327]